MIDPGEMTKFLSGVVGVVEANSYEKHMLWNENRQRESPRVWEENLSGFIETIGHINKVPVCISLNTAEVAYQKILFVDPTSQVVDHRMVDKWLKDNLPKSAFRSNGYVNKTNAMNFHTLF